MRGAAPSVGCGARMGNAIVEARKDFRADRRVLAAARDRRRTARSRLTVKMPDSLTRYRVVALATASTRYFGKAESTIVAQRKVNARTVAPRFLTQGDTFSLPVVVQNLDAQPRTIDVAVRAANLAPARPRRQARRRSRAASAPRCGSTSRPQARGKAVIQTIASSGDVRRRVERRAAGLRAGDDRVVRDLRHRRRRAAVRAARGPGDIFPDVGGVEVELASTQLQSLTDAYWYLYAYPYECAEQRSSAHARDRGDVRHPRRVRDARAARRSRQIDAQLASDVDELLRKEQRPDGGWGYFRGMKSDPFVTMQVLPALVAPARSPARPPTKRAIAFVTKRGDRAARASSSRPRATRADPARRSRRASRTWSRSPRPR